MISLDFLTTKPKLNNFFVARKKKLLDNKKVSFQRKSEEMWHTRENENYINMKITNSMSMPSRK